MSKKTGPAPNRNSTAQHVVAALKKGAKTVYDVQQLLPEISRKAITSALHSLENRGTLKRDGFCPSQQARGPRNVAVWLLV